MSEPRTKVKFAKEPIRRVPTKLPQVDLNDPKDARYFLRGVKVNGKHISFVQLADGRQLSIDEMTDKEAVGYAKDIYIDFIGGIEGKPGIVELDPIGREQ